MLKFTVDKPDAHLVFCGLSQGNVKRLAAGEAIVFDADVVGLERGKVVIAHDADPGVQAIRSQRPAWVRDLIVLSDDDLRRMAGDMLERPLEARSDGKACRSVLFSGTTEEGMVADLARAGIVAPTTRIEAPADFGTRLYPVSFLHQAKLVAGALTMFVLAYLTIGDSFRASRVLLPLVAGFVAIGLVFVGIGIARLQQRVEINATDLRVRGPFGFTVPWRDVARLLSRDDVDGPYELIVETKQGKRRKLQRIYQHWDDLVEDVTRAIR